MIMIVFGLPLKLTINIRSFHFTIYAKAFSDLESINMPTPPHDALFVLRHAEVVISIYFSCFSYLIFYLWQILLSTIPTQFLLSDSSYIDFRVCCRGGRSFNPGAVCLRYHALVVGCC